MFWTSITNIADAAREKLIQNFFFSRSRIPCAAEIGYLRLAKAAISSLLNEAFTVENFGSGTATAHALQLKARSFERKQPMMFAAARASPVALPVAKFVPPSFENAVVGPK